MTPLPPSIQGFGLKTLTTDTLFQIVIDSRGGFEWRFDLVWAPGVVRVALPSMTIAANKNAFLVQRDAAIDLLREIPPAVETLLGDAVSVLRGLARWTLIVKPTELVLDLTERPERSTLLRVVQYLAKIAEALALPGANEASRLMYGYWHLKDPIHRRHELEQLYEHHRDKAMTAETLRDAMLDEAPELRLYAATKSGEAGLSTLRRLAETHTLELDLRLDALQAYRSLAKPEERRAMLGRLARSRDQRIAAVAMDALDREPADFVVPVLMRIVNAEDEVLAVAAVRKLARHPHAVLTFEAFLIGIFEAERTHESLRHAIVDLLGEIGTSASLVALKRANRFWINAKLKVVLKEAVAHLEPRVAFAEPGALSITADGGELSEAKETRDEQ